jgi:murein DD-endopeptidase MepM/ murein hydrolase activator NlpD
MKSHTWVLSAMVVLVSAMVVLAIAFAQRLHSRQADAATQGEASRQSGEYLDLPVNIEAPLQPLPVKGSDGKWYLVYHLFLTNWSFSDLTLKSVEVSHGEQAKTLTRYADEELSDSYRFRALIPTPPKSEMPNKMYPRQLASGRTGVLFFWLTVDAPNAIPLTLKHRLTFEANPLIKLLRDSSSDKNGDMVLDNFKVAVGKDKPVVLGAPLRGGPWRCSNGPAYNSVHQYLGIREGKVSNAQRFAIDFNKVDAEGNILPNPFPNKISNKMFYGYGNEVLAVADGVVAFVKDGIPENVPQASGEIKPAVPITRETVSGNWISIDLGRNRYAFFAHLQPGSIRVKVGDRVRKGQVIGLLGNSGNAVSPHLHFHIGDANSLNGSEGLPFVFDSFDVDGQTERHILEMPLNNNVVRFQ